MGRSPKLPRGPVGYCVERSCARRQAPWNMEQLDALAEHHVLWLATNGSQTLQMNKLVQAELSDRFHTLFISQDVGFPKSHPAFVTAVQAQLDINGFDVCLVIGDSMENDMQLAHAGGWRGVHLCGPAQCGETEPPGITHLASVSGVSNLCTCRQYRRGMLPHFSHLVCRVPPAADSAERCHVPRRNDSVATLADSPVGVGCSS